MALKHSPRIKVLKILVACKTIRWKNLIEQSGTTNGSLGVTLTLLLNDGYVKKAIAGGKEVIYEITEAGMEAFEDYKKELLA